MRRPSIRVRVCLPSSPRSARVLRPPTWRGLSVRPGAPRTASSRSPALRAAISSAVMTVVLAGAVRTSCSVSVAVTVTLRSTAAGAAASEDAADAANAVGAEAAAAAGTTAWADAAPAHQGAASNVRQASTSGRRAQGQAASVGSALEVKVGFGSKWGRSGVEGGFIGQLRGPAGAGIGSQGDNAGWRRLPRVGGGIGRIRRVRVRVRAQVNRSRSPPRAACRRPCRGPGASAR
jgi:hypothetical protein